MWGKFQKPVHLDSVFWDIVYNSRNKSVFLEPSSLHFSFSRRTFCAGQKKTAPLTNIRGADIMSIEKVLTTRVSSRTLLINKKIDYTSLEGCGDQSFLFCLLSMYCKTFNVMSMVWWIVTPTNVSSAITSSIVIGHPPFADRLRGDCFLQKSPSPEPVSFHGMVQHAGMGAWPPINAGSTLPPFSGIASVSYFP